MLMECQEAFGHLDHLLLLPAGELGDRFKDLSKPAARRQRPRFGRLSQQSFDADPKRLGHRGEHV